MGRPATLPTPHTPTGWTGQGGRGDQEEEAGV